MVHLILQPRLHLRLRQTHHSTQSASRLSTPYQPQVKVPKSVSFGKNVIPAGAESSHMGQPTYASKASQILIPEVESRGVIHMRGEHHLQAMVALGPREGRPLRGLSHSQVHLPRPPSVLGRRELWRYPDRHMNMIVLVGTGMSNTFSITSSTRRSPRSLPQRGQP